jgi:ankyrin repeat protein
LLQVTFKCNFEFVKLLIEKEADKELSDNEGSGPLHQAASQGNQDLVEALLHAGTNVNAKSHGGNSPLIRGIFLFVMI